MRILHVVTLATPDNDYGGPVRVAVGQLAELAGRGHDVLLVAAASAPLLDEDRYLGVPFRGFPVQRVIPRTGYAGLRARGLTAWLRREAASFDIVHIHLARDLVTLPAALAAERAGIPTVVQTHGMIVPRGDAAARLLDATLTRRALAGAGEVLALNAVERDQLRAVAPAVREPAIVPNGIDATSDPERPAREGLDVLFLSRLHPRKRPDAFARAAGLVGVDATFSIAGPDEGALADVEREAGTSTADVRIEGPIAPERVAERMARADVFVLPAVDEPFGMVVLEAMAAGTPVVVTDTCGLADDVARAGAGIVVDGSDASLADAIRTLLQDAGLRREMGERGRELSRRFSVAGVADKLEHAYARVLDDAPRR